MHDINNIDLFNLLQIVLDRSSSKNEAIKKAIQYSEKHTIDKSVIMTVVGATNSKIDYKAFEKGVDTMCTLFEEIAAEGRIEGRAEGIIKMLKKYNESDETIKKELMSEFQISENEAEEYLDKYNKRANMAVKN